MFQIGQGVIAADRLLPEEHAPFGGEALHQVLWPLGDEIPSQMGEADEGGSAGGRYHAGRLGEGEAVLAGPCTEFSKRRMTMGRVGRELNRLICLCKEYLLVFAMNIEQFAQPGDGMWPGPAGQYFGRVDEIALRYRAAS